MLIFFLFFASLMILGAIGVIVSKNSVYSVLWLIFTFLNSSGIFVLLNAEFIAMTMIIVYVGAVAVLFLFVVMTLDVDVLSKVKEEIKIHWILSVLAVALFIIDSIALIKISFFNESVAKMYFIDHNDTGFIDTQALGNVIYTDYFDIFQISGVILLLAMISAIVLTIRKRNGVKTQDVCAQLSRDNNVTLINVPKDGGIDDINYE